MARLISRQSSSVRQLLRGVGRSADPEEVVRERARELVAHARAHGWSGPPFDLAVLAEFRDIKVEVEPPSVVADAVLVPDPISGQFTIKVSSGMPDERQRFNIGHEITHTFFPDCAHSIQLRGGRSTRAADRDVETLCDIGAAEMLFPLDVFLHDVAALDGPSLATLVGLRGRYFASWEATGNRLVSTSDVPCAMVLLRLRLKPTEERRGMYLPGLEPRPKLRVEYSVRSEYLDDNFVPPHKSISEGSRLYELTTPEWSGDTVAGIEDWSDLGLGRVAVEAMRLPTEEGETRVLALVRPVH